TDRSSTRTTPRLSARPLPFFRERGFGAPVMCLHASLGSSSHWRPVMDVLARGYHVVAPDLYGYGRSPDWPAAEPLRLSDEVALVEPLLEIIDEPVHLIGHGYGAAVALQATVQWPERVKSLVLYEPLLFTVLALGQAEHPVDLGVHKLRTDTLDAVACGDVDGAAERYVDYWSGRGSWARMPRSRRQSVLDGMLKVRHELGTPGSGDLSLGELGRIAAPALLMHGAESPPAMARSMALLAGRLPRAQTLLLKRAGHMAPVTQPGRIGSLVTSFLCRIDPPTSIAA
ncbi:MAG: alpha/beta hydrolase, partial [Gammaproteobacteria bacterium]|nr:alpha/beta hydrolase [Gammaproteobacteria bacterium]